MASQKISAKTRRIVEAAVRANLGDMTIKAIVVRPDVTPFDNDALEVNLHFAASNQPLPTLYRRAMAMAISDALAAHGEERFPYVEYHFDEEPKIEDRQRAS